MPRNDDLCDFLKKFKNRIILYQQPPCPNPRSCFCNSSCKGSPRSICSPPNLSFFGASERQMPQQGLSVYHLHLTPQRSPFWPLLPEDTAKPPDRTEAGVHLQITAAKWIALTKCNVLWQSPNMHFILEKQLKEPVGNIKLSSVTAENNWVFCPVACDFV